MQSDVGTPTRSTSPPCAARFPALFSDAVYLDGPGGSQVPEEVAAAMSSYLFGSNANLGGAFPTSAASDDMLEDARGSAAEFMGGEPDGIAFGANMTTLNFLLAHAVARTLEPGDEIMVTSLDHDANVSPWLLVARDHGLNVRVAPIRTADVTLDVDALEGMIGDRTAVVAFTLASNAVGSIPDAGRIAAAAHRVGALAWADGVHLAPHRRLRARELGLDVVLCSPYKFFGPHLGIATSGRTWPSRCRPIASGPPTSTHPAIASRPARCRTRPLPAPWPPSTTCAHSATATSTRRSRAIESHERGLTERFLAGLPEGVTLYGIAGARGRTPTSASRPRSRAREIAERAGRARPIRLGRRLLRLEPMRALGLEPDGAVRAGFLHYTTEAEVDRLLEALAELSA